MTKEDHLQHQVITWLAWRFPDLRYHHSPDAGRRSPFERFKYKFLGSDSGFPDLIFPSLGLVIELKIKPNRPSEYQLEWLLYFRTIKWCAEVCYTFDEARILIEDQVELLRKDLHLIEEAKKSFIQFKKQ